MGLAVLLIQEDGWRWRDDDDVFAASVVGSPTGNVAMKANRCRWAAAPVKAWQAVETVGAVPGRLQGL